MVNTSTTRSILWPMSPRLGPYYGLAPCATLRDGRRETEGGKVQDPDFELWRQRHEQMLQEAERYRLARELRAARRRESSRLCSLACRLADRIADKILAALRTFREKTRS